MVQNSKKKFKSTKISTPKSNQLGKDFALPCKSHKSQKSQLKSEPIRIDLESDTKQMLQYSSRQFLKHCSTSLKQKDLKSSKAMKRHLKNSSQQMSVQTGKGGGKGMT